MADFARENPGLSGEDHFPPAMMRQILRGRQNQEHEGDHNERSLAGKGDTAYERVNVLRQRLVPQDHWMPRDRIWYQAWRGWCRDEGILDFTGWLEAELERPHLPYQQVVFADEAQDHTPLQLAVLRGWRTQNLVLVGDDDQNLYEWSGAVPEAFFTPELPEDQERVLGTSYRVPAAVHELANSIVNRISRRRVKAYEPREGDRGYVRDEPTCLAHVKEGYLPEDVLNPPGTVMLLTTCRYMLRPIISVLKQEGIPFHNPYSAASDLNPLRTTAPILEAYLDGGWKRGQIADWLQFLAEGKALRRREKARFLEAAERDPGATVSADELRTLMLPEALALAMARDVRLFTRERRVVSLGGSNWDYAMRVYQRSDPTPKVIVGTVHSVKGGEADHVHIYPDLSPAGYADYMSSGRDRVNRLAYVAVTRARVGVVRHTPEDVRAMMLR